MAQPPQPPSDIVWSPAPGAAPGQPPAASGSPAADAAPPDVVWDNPAPAQPAGWHTLKAVAAGALGSMAFLGGDTDEFNNLMQRTHRLGNPNPTAGDKVAEFVGGAITPIPGPSLVAKGGRALASAVDTALGTTAGQRTGSGALQFLESTLSRLPGGGAITTSIKRQSDRLAATSDDIVSNLAGGADTSAAGAGKVLKDQLKVAAKRMKDEAGAQFDEVEKLIPEATPIGIKAYDAALTELTTARSASAAEAAGANMARFKGLKAALEKDLSNSHLNALPYGVLKEIRTKLGGEIDWGPFSTNPANGDLKRLYTALTADMANGAANASPKAAAAVKAANASYAAAKQQAAVLKSILNKAGGPEKVFNALMSGTKEGSETLRLVLANVDQPSRQLLAASALQRMGHAVPSAQTTVAAAQFSADTFMTNWAKMEPTARDALFGSLPSNYAQSINQLVAHVGALKAYTKVLPNSSNTAQAAIWGGAVGTALLSLWEGDFKTAAALAGSAVGNKILSAALTNPTTAKWFAKQTAKRLTEHVAKGAAGVEANDDTPELSTLH